MARTRLKKSRPRPLVLAIIEGFGITAAGDANPILSATTPFFDQLLSHYPTALLEASGEAIGLEPGMSSNSRIGHYIIGHGRAWPKTSRLISESLADGSYRNLEGIQKLEKNLATHSKRVHLIGLISSADVETKMDHLPAILAAVNLPEVEHIFIHGVLDGREISETAGQRLVQEVSTMIAPYQKVSLASIMGRLYGLDDKHNSSRTDKAIDLLVKGEAVQASSLENALAETYDKKIFDEEFPPTIFSDSKEFCIKEGDTVIFWNHKGVGFVSLAEALLKNVPKLSLFTMTDYGLGDKATTLFTIEQDSPSLGTVLAEHTLKQLRIGDSAGFFGSAYWLDDFAKPIFDNVERQLIPIHPSLDLETACLDSMTEMRRACVEAITSAQYDCIIISFSQLDLISHQGSPEQVIKIVSAIDAHLKAIAETTQASDGVMIITASHAGAERIIDPATGETFKEHSLNPVFISVLGKRFQGYNLGWPELNRDHLELAKPIGTLVDVAPSILSLLLLKKPESMTGNNLIP